VYVIGHVLKAGPLIYDQHGKMTALQAVSAAGGMDNLAKAKEARILRVVPGQDVRSEIPLNLDGIMQAQIADVPLEVEDIVLVPNNKPKAIMLKSLEVAIQVGTGVIIWHKY
jgi:protein involved in polysaccharide export with SLBB domain